MSSRLRVAGVAVIAAIAMSACDAGADPRTSAPSTDEHALTYLAFGDSWPYGGHCNGCVPFPVLLHAGLEEMTGEPVRFVNEVRGEGTAEELAEAMVANSRIRDAIAEADLIVIAIGGNDMGPAFEAWVAGTCGGDDDLECFRTVRDRLRESYDTMLTQIGEIRSGRPTAVRMVTTSNEALAEYHDLLGPDFGATAGVSITAMNRDAQCEVAEAHGAVCVDLGLALNGPDLLTPVNVNTQDAMQQVADVILAAGLAELGR